MTCSGCGREVVGPMWASQRSACCLPCAAADGALLALRRVLWELAETPPHLRASFTPLAELARAALARARSPAAHSVPLGPGSP